MGLRKHGYKYLNWRLEANIGIVTPIITLVMKSHDPFSKGEASTGSPNHILRRIKGLSKQGSILAPETWGLIGNCSVHNRSYYVS